MFCCSLYKFLKFKNHCFLLPFFFSSSANPYLTVTRAQNNNKKFGFQPSTEWIEENSLLYSKISANESIYLSYNYNQDVKNKKKIKKANFFIKIIRERTRFFIEIFYRLKKIIFLEDTQSLRHDFFKVLSKRKFSKIIIIPGYQKSH